MLASLRDFHGQAILPLHCSGNGLMRLEIMLWCSISMASGAHWELLLIPRMVGASRHWTH
ncbi:hypothetical protein QR66_09870 [Chromobacterium piscinae]|nr:hypothetical protein QR66_09870 [Chromobacterium piscinae]